MLLLVALVNVDAAKDNKAGMILTVEIVDIMLFFEKALYILNGTCTKSWKTIETRVSDRRKIKLK